MKINDKGVASNYSGTHAKYVRLTGKNAKGYFKDGVEFAKKDRPPGYTKMKKHTTVSAHRMEEVAGDWYLDKAGPNKGYAYHRRGGKTTYLHKFLQPSADVTHHRNSLKLDNTDGNLKATSKSEDVSYRPLHNSTGHTGVYENPRTGKFEARFQFQGHNQYLGTYTTAEEAGHAYKEQQALFYGP